MSINKKRIGVFINSFSNRHTEDFAKGLLEQSLIHDVETVFFAGRVFRGSRNDINSKHSVFSVGHEAGIDGMVFLYNSISSFCNESACRSFLAGFRNTPAILVGENNLPYPGIFMPNYGPAYTLTEHLIRDHGCRNIAFQSGPVLNSDVIIRHKAYRDALEDNGLKYNPDLVLTGPSDMYFCADLLDELENGRHKADAIVCANDNIAMNTCKTLESRGLKVPEDVLLTGFDGYTDYGNDPISLTTVNQPVQRIGHESLEMLRLLFADGCPEQYPVSRTLEGELVYNRSCGCSGHRHFRKQNSAYELELMKKYLFFLGFLKETMVRVFSITELESALEQMIGIFGIDNAYVLLSGKAGINAGQKNRSAASVEICNEQQGLMTQCIARHIRNTPVSGCRRTGFVFDLSDNFRTYGYVMFMINTGDLLGSEHFFGKVSSFFDDLVNEITMACIRIDNMTKREKPCAGRNMLVLPDYLGRIAYKKLLAYMENKKPYMEQDLTLHALSSKLNLSRNKLSFVINKYAGKNYYDFINDYRVKAAKRILNDSGHVEKKIIDIAEEAGFNSKATFNKVFREYIRMSPREYRTKHRK
ncbi:MAG: substrate-binding domain-containing protein [Spirochaetales bacterium]|nr:substrate-binding domain-containing protein [Spirochaetales bacterium]